MKLSTTLLLLVAVILGIIVFAGSAKLVFAAIEFDNPIKANNIAELIHGIASWIRNIGLVLATVVILWAAFMYLTSGGSEERVTQAKKALFWSIVGIAILLIGSGITGIIKGILSVQ